MGYYADIQFRFILTILVISLTIFLTTIRPKDAPMNQELREVYINDCNNVFGQIIDAIDTRLPNESLEITVDCPVVMAKEQMLVGGEGVTVIFNGGYNCL